MKQQSSGKERAYRDHDTPLVSMSSRNRFVVHVPKSLKISACIQTKEWSSTTFLFDLGLFQGCVLSCVLFSCVFQLLLDLLAPLAEQNGYHFRDSPIVLHEQAFADDLSILSSCPRLSQATIDVVQRFLEWAFFKAKPSKCVCMAMKKFDLRSQTEKSSYSPFDPNLTIAGEKIKFIVNVALDPNSLQYDHFKELGRFISVT